MAETRPVTGGDLFSLRKIADEHVPNLADMFADANHKLKNLADDARAAFAHDDHVGTDDDPAYPWQEMREILQAIVGINAERLLQTQTAVNAAITAFLDTDTASASGLAEIDANAQADLNSLEATGKDTRGHDLGHIDRPENGDCDERGPEDDEIPVAPEIPRDRAGQLNPQPS